jgi:hypothetical protein
VKYEVYFSGAMPVSPGQEVMTISGWSGKVHSFFILLLQPS